ncbi:MAG: peptidoglycan recognition protein family protein, partial [Acidimicrobiales bacterium]
RWGSGASQVGLVAIDAEHGPRHLVRARPAAARADVAQPEVVPRGHWGADESRRRAPPSFAPVDRIVVHHTVTPNNDPDPAATMRAMHAYHVKANGWDDTGYNFVIDAAGHVFEGRWARPYGAGEHPTGESAIGEGVVGAHAEGQNAGSVGVALMGTFTGRSAPTPAAVDALQRLLAWKADRHGIDAAGTATWAGGAVLPTIAGHNQVGRTSCPGDQLTARLPGIRQAVASAVGAVHNALTAGYWVLGRDGRALPFGRASTAPPALGGLLSPLLVPAAGIAATPSGLGYWVVSDGGRVLPAGDALPLGSPDLLALLQQPSRAVAIEATPSGLGYWVAEERGRVRGFGDAPDLGSAPAGPVTAMARTPSGRGYWLATAEGRVSAHGDAVHMGSAQGRSRSPVVAMAVARKGRGYWLVTADGSVFGFGLARRAGGLPEAGIRAQVVDAQASASGKGYYLLGSDGAVFTFGDAVFHGAPTGLPSGAAGLALVP